MESPARRLEMDGQRMTALILALHLAGGAAVGGLYLGNVCLR